VIDVLVIDDIADLLELATRALQRAGFSAVGVKNFEELDAVMVEKQPRLILMDVQMPELFGDDVAATLRDVRGVKAKIYLYSSLDTDELEVRARDAGLDGAWSKSAGISYLVDSVRKVLADPASD
jgi:two-component system OmpR family response regulator